MGRSPKADTNNKGAWTKEEDGRLVAHILAHGEGSWRSVPKAASLLRRSNSCRNRWMNYLRPDLKKGNFTEEEDELIIKLHSLLGNKWSLIASRLPGRTDNEIKNYWNRHIRRKLLARGIDPETHRPMNNPPPESVDTASVAATTMTDTISFSGRSLKENENNEEVSKHSSGQNCLCSTFQIPITEFDELHYSASDAIGVVELSDTYYSDSSFGTDASVEGEQENNTVRDATEFEENHRTSCMELQSNQNDAMEGDQQINPIRANVGKKAVMVSEKKTSKDTKRLYNITYEQLERHFGKPLAHVAKALGLSKSTIKRSLKGLGIKRWPNDDKYIDNPSLYFTSTKGDHVEASTRQHVVDGTCNNSALSNEALHQQPIQDSNTWQGKQNVVELMRNNEFVTIKAIFMEEIVKFNLDKNSKMDTLNQEIASGFDVEVGRFKLKYLDEDNELILLRRDQDLDVCINKLKELGKTMVKIEVQLTSP